MSFLRSVWSDLVDKRLWPVAVALVAALIAVPLLLGGGAEEPVAAVAGGPTGAAGATNRPVVTLDPSSPSRRDRPGRSRDPFKPQVAAKGATGAAGVSSVQAPSGGGSASGSGGAGTGGSATTSGSSGTTGASGLSSSKPAKPAAPAYVLLVRFGRTDGDRTRRRLERLEPLPSAEAPFLVFDGVLGDHRTAVLLLSSAVSAKGDGTCRPRASSCETVELRPGDSETFTVTADDGTVRSYDFDLLDVLKDGQSTRTAADSSAKAPGDAVAARADAADQDADGGSSAGAGSYRFDKRTGLLTRVRGAARGATGPADDAPAADQAR